MKYLVLVLISIVSSQQEFWQNSFNETQDLGSGVASQNSTVEENNSTNIEDSSGQSFLPKNATELPSSGNTTEVETNFQNNTETTENNIVDSPKNATKAQPQNLNITQEGSGNPSTNQTIAETKTASETVSEKAPETTQETMPETVSETIPENDLQVPQNTSEIKEDEVNQSFGLGSLKDEIEKYQENTTQKEEETQKNTPKEETEAKFLQSEQKIEEEVIEGEPMIGELSQEETTEDTENSNHSRLVLFSILSIYLACI